MSNDDTKRIERIETKLDKVSESINSIDKTLLEQHMSLKEHMRRTELLEHKIEPIEAHVHMIQGFTKFVGILGVIAAIVEGIAVMLTYLKR